MTYILYICGMGVATLSNMHVYCTMGRYLSLDILKKPFASKLTSW